MKDRALQETLQQTFENASLFDQWDDRYYYPEAVRFYQMAFDFIAGALGVMPGDTVLDAGCGPARHSMHFAARNVRCVAIDRSEAVLDEARQRVRAARLDDRIEFRREDLTSLTFPDGTFAFAFCWGVLMHVPDIDKAVGELARVLKPGGRIAFSLLNPRSADAAMLKLARALRGSRRDRQGGSDWVRDTTGPIYVRGNTPSAFARVTDAAGLRTRERRAAQFTEYRAPAGLPRTLVAGLNEGWFRFVRSTVLSGGYIVIAEKPSDGA
jgi:ubiquinone/menaquinone biosynthesis C-methylase UbiE